MEYREGRCPKCNETMQIPIGREKIICMFCGQEFSLTESKQSDEAAYKTELARFRENADSVFADFEKTLKGFQRNEYENSFERYLQVQNGNLKAIRQMMRLTQDQEKAEDEIAEAVLASARKIMDERGGKLNRQSMQMSLNMYMVTFVLPAVLSIEEEKYSDLAQLICKKWAETFKNSNIQAAGYNTLKSGFRRKLCYITTAVCEGLRKPENCRELVLLEQYRDGYLASSAEGRELVRQYYDMAPTIVKRIERKEEHEQIYRALYETYISPCVQLIEEQRNEECREKYQEMVEMLRAEYM
ncbi:MAG: hypothetical protein J6C33_08660 [Lachnospiraceae bacterium]|nr:hypothetical protein [Lachnospiraceae bacterium]